MNKSTALNAYARYIPIVVPILLVIVQALIDSGTLHLTAQSLAIVDALLGAVGLHALHIRTK